MAVSTIPAQSARTVQFNLNNDNGKTLDVDIGSNNNNVGLLISSYGPGAPLNALIYAAGYGKSNTNYKTVNQIVAANNITCTAQNTGFQIKNTHTSYGCWVSVTVFESLPGSCTFAQSE